MFMDVRHGSPGAFGFMLGCLPRGMVTCSSGRSLQCFQKVLQVETT